MFGQKKKMQQWADEVSLETEIKLKSNDGTHSTSVRRSDAVSWIEPMCVTIWEIDTNIVHKLHISEKFGGSDHMVSGSSINNPLTRRYDRFNNNFSRKHRMIQV